MRAESRMYGCLAQPFGMHSLYERLLLAKVTIYDCILSMICHWCMLCLILLIINDALLLCDAALSKHSSV